MNALRRMRIWMFLCVAISGCTSRDRGNVPLTDEQNKAKTQLESQMRQVAETKQIYHAMNNDALLEKLMEQSKAQREPFNSPAYRELKDRRDVDSKALAALVKGNDNSSGLLPLLLLRKLDDKSYLGLPAELRAKILTNALEHSKYFNVWGLPNFYLEDASRAMFEAGKSAVPELSRMLSDTRPAPVFGSQEAMVYQQYKYRVCDYALLFLEQIAGKQDFRMPVSPAERDVVIKEMSAK